LRWGNAPDAFPMPTAHPICPVDDLPPGQRKIVTIHGKSIGVFNVHGKFHAIRNVCPHQLAPLCEGAITGTARPSDKGPGHGQWHRDGELIRCPWHGWEFDIATGQSVFNPHRCRVKSYQVTVEPAPANACGGEPATRTVGPDDPDPAVETFEVTVEQRQVVLHV